MAFGRAYRKFFDGWSEKESVDEKGVSRIQRVYTGYLYRLEQPDSVWKKRKAICGALTVGALACLGAGAMLSENSVWYSVLPVALCLLAALVTVPLLILFVISRREMEERSFRDRKNLISAAMAMGGLMGLAAVGSLVRAFGMAEGREAELAAVLLFAMGAAMMLTMGLTENRQDYFRRKSGKPMDPEAYEIRDEKRIEQI